MSDTEQHLQVQRDFHIDRIFWMTIALTIIAFVSLALSIVLVVRFPAWQFISLSVVSGITLATNLASIICNRHGKGAISLNLLFWPLLFILPINVLLFTPGTPVLIGIVLLVGILEVYFLFPTEYRGKALLGPFLSAGIMILIEYVNPSFRINIGTIATTSQFAQGAFLFLIVCVLLLVLQQVTKGNIRTKLITSFVFIAIISVGSTALFTQQTLSISLSKGISDNLAELGNTRASEIGMAIEHELKLLKVLALNTSLQDAATSYSHAVPISQVDIEILDRQWRNADLSNNDTDPLVENIITNRFSNELRIFQDKYPLHAEIFLTNIQGVNIAATQRTSDYFHADEEWWLITFQDGGYISPPKYNESKKVLILEMAVVVRQNGIGQIMGILHSTIKFTSLTDSLVAGLFGQTGRNIIVQPNGKMIFLTKSENEKYELNQAIAPDEINLLTSSTSPINRIALNGTSTLVTQTELVVPDDTEEAKVVKKLGWKIITLQDQTEALQPVTNQTRNIALLAFGIIGIVAIAAIILARIFSIPITHLTTTANTVASGILDVEAKVETGDEIGTLAKTFNKMTAQLRDMVGLLEQRVAERTSELESILRKNNERNAQLEAIADVARSIASLKGIDQLLPEITKLISRRFGFYHVGIFLLDDAKEFVVLRAANSEGGEKLLAHNHKLRVGQQGIVGYAVAQKRARIALDVGSDAVFFDNPDLPLTRSEMALPLVIGNIVIGALDVQSEQSNAFTEEDIQVISTLADQVAIAIENARLFEQSQKSLKDLEYTFERYIRNEWQKYSESTAIKGYRANSSGIEPITNVDFDIDKSNSNIHAIPLSVHGVTIGTLKIDLGKSQNEYSQEEIDILNAIADRAALALEGSRLLEETQRRAQRERVVAEITTKIRSTNDPQIMVDTATAELQKVLGTSKIIIKPAIQSQTQSADSMQDSEQST